MKPLLLWTLALLGAAGAARAQALRGEYGTPDSVVSFDKYFLRFEGQRFFYLHAGCLGAEEGRGTFRLVQNQLELRFEHSAADTTALIVRPGRAGDPATTFRFRVQMPGDGHYIGATPTSISSKATRNRVQADINGDAVLRYDMPANDTLLVDSRGQQTYLPVRAGVSQTFIVRLYEDRRYIEAGRTMKLRARQATPTALSLEEFLYLDDDGQPQFLRFKVYRLSAAETAKFLRH